MNNVHYNTYNHIHIIKDNTHTHTIPFVLSGINSALEVPLVQLAVGAGVA